MNLQNMHNVLLTFDILTEFFALMTVINLAVLVVASLALWLARQWVISIHQRFVPLSEDDLNKAYFTYLANFKIAWLMLNVAPWLALSIM